jgi:hypothetical protein
MDIFPPLTEIIEWARFEDPANANSQLIVVKQSTEVPLLCIDINGAVAAAARLSNKSPRSSRSPTPVTENNELVLDDEGILYLVYPVPPETYS